MDPYWPVAFAAAAGLLVCAGWLVYDVLRWRAQRRLVKRLAVQPRGSRAVSREWRTISGLALIGLEVERDVFPAAYGTAEGLSREIAATFASMDEGQFAPGRSK